MNTQAQMFYVDESLQSQEVPVKVVEMIEQSRKWDALKLDVDVPVSRLSFDGGNGFHALVEHDQPRFVETSGGFSLTKEEQYGIEDRALTHLGGFLGLSAHFLRKTLDFRHEEMNQLVADALNKYKDIGYDQDKEWKLRLFDGSIRAVASTRYSHFGVTNMLEVAEQVLKVSRAVPERQRFDRDGITMRVFWPDDSGGNYAVGLYMRTDEVKESSVVIAPLVQRHSCKNSIVSLKDGAFNHKHIGLSGPEWYVHVQAALNAALRHTETMREQIAIRQRSELEDPLEVLNQILNKVGVKSDDVKQRAAQGTEGQRNEMAVINGLTFAAQHTGSEDEALLLEATAGQLLAEGLFAKLQRVEVSD